MEKPFENKIEPPENKLNKIITEKKSNTKVPL